MRNNQTRICIVTDELAGPDFNGGIGTACQGLALTLSAAGHQVDVLYTRVAQGAVECTVGAFPDHVERFRNRGVRLLAIAHAGPWNDYAGKSFAALHHLQSEAYDFVFFNDTHGTGFYPILSRRTGNPRLRKTSMCVVTHSATQWIADLNAELVTRTETLRLFEMERQSIELSDVVFSPSAHLIGKYKEYGWRFPAETHVRRNIMPASWQDRNRSSTERQPIDELVFFGRLETRKGIDLFCGALDRLKYALRGRRVTFLGKDTVVNGVSSLEKVVRRSSAWPFEIQILPDFDRERALNYLQNGRRLAIMPSVEENSPCAIQECLELGIPFIASSGSGGQELIAEHSREHCCCPPTVPDLVRKIEEILEAGARTGDLSFDPEENKRSLVDWLDGYLSQSRGKAAPAAHRSGADDAPSAVPVTLIVVGAGQLDQASIKTIAAGHAAALGGPVRTAVVAHAAGGRELPLPQGGGIELLTPDNYSSFIASIDTRGESFVSIWDASLEFSKDWVVRARAHLTAARDCIGVTGLATRGAASPLKEPPPYVSLASNSPQLLEPIVGATEAVALLSQNSNSGFALLPSAAFRAVGGCTPWDGVYARAKDAEEWIDELVQELRQHGGAPALIPDAPVSRSRLRPYFEVFRKGQSRRSSLATTLDHRPGSARALLDAFGMDRLADVEAGREAFAFLESVAEHTKIRPQEWTPGAGAGNAHLEKLAVAAFRTGQMDLSKEILAYLGSLTGGTAHSLLDEVDRFWEGERQGQLLLAGLVGASTTWRSEGAIRASIAVESDENAIVFPICRFESGRGLISFQVDLTGFSSFSSVLSIQGSKDQRLWFYAGLTSTDQETKMGVECQAVGRSEHRVDFAVPEELRKPCKLDLIAERRSNGSSELTAIWRNPHFKRASAELAQEQLR